jgi:pimeloyl-ACP methyl ester carboxylesterase
MTRERRLRGCQERGQGRFGRTFGIASVVVGLTLSASGARAEAPVRCQRLTFQVALVAGQPANNQMAAWLCTRGSIQHKTVQVVIHGATYDHNMWDFPFQPERYSYVHYMTAAGYAVLNLDRIGYGESSHPPSGFLDLDLHKAAFTIHQVVQELRSGNLEVEGFGHLRAEKVELVGHSLGSFTASIEAATYDDVDGVILSGYTHTVGPGGAIGNTLAFPAAFDPKFAPLDLAFDYLSIDEATRNLLFNFLPDMDPVVQALDFDLRMTVPAGDLADIFPSFPATNGMHVPTLLVVGNHDSIACAANDCIATNTLATEPANYPADACLEMQIIPEAGHALNLHLNAQTWFGVAREWSDRRVGASTKKPPAQSCP